MKQITYNSKTIVPALLGYLILVIVHIFFYDIMPLPVGFLAAASLFCCPPAVTLFLFFSAVGDWAGAYGTFLLQMCAFAIAHVALIYHFCRSNDLWKRIRAQKNTCVSALVIGLAVLATALWKVLPGVPPGVLTWGVTIYCLLIIYMWFLSCFHSFWVMVGATLFVTSDFILAWNRFVSPVEAARLWILVPYFAAVGLIFMGIATKLRNSTPILK